jgi:hypothetical protein
MALVPVVLIGGILSSLSELGETEAGLAEGGEAGSKPGFTTSSVAQRALGNNNRKSESLG